MVAFASYLCSFSSTPNVPSDSYAAGYKLENGTTITIDALLIPNVGGGGAASSMASVLDVSLHSLTPPHLLKIVC